MKEFDNNGEILKLSPKKEKERKVAFDQIRKKAILVNMTRKQISNMPFDVTLSNTIAETLNISDNSLLQVRKLLFNPTRLAKIRSLINDSVLMIWNHTRPWDNIGFRLLPMEYYDDFNETFGKIKDEFEEATKEFVDNYAEILAESKKALGKAYRKNDYPDQSQIAHYFALEIHTSEFPDIDDIRLNLSGPELARMQEDIVERYQGTINETLNEITAMINLGDKESAVRLIRVAEKLNLAGDNPEITMKIVELKEQFGQDAFDDIKEKEDITPENMMIADDEDIGDFDLTEY